MNKEIAPDSNSIWRAFNGDKEPRKLGQVFIDGVYHKLGISVKKGQQRAIAVNRGNDEAKTAMRKAVAFYPGIAEIIQKSAGQESNEDFTIGCNTFF